MIRTVALCLAIFAAGPASALSCAVPTVSGQYQHAADSPENYTIAVGNLRMNGPSNPPEGAVALGGDINQMVGYTQPALFQGEFFTGNGFGNRRTVEVTVDVTCVVAWCGSAGPVENAMFFFRAVDGGYVLDAGACPTSIFAPAVPGMMQEVVACYNGSCPGNF